MPSARRERSRGATAALIGLALSGLAIAPHSAGAQSVASVFTIEQSIASLREMIQELESGRAMVLVPFGIGLHAPMVYVERDRVGSIAGSMVVRGMLHPDSIPQWTQEQIRLSRGALQAMKEQLAEYEAQRDGHPLPSDGRPGRSDRESAAIQPVYWPTPMDWTEVGGTVRGRYRIECTLDDDRLPPLTGTFTLELRGAGIVLGSFTDSDGRTQAVNGRISETGSASGSVATGRSTTGWSAEFVRSGNALEIRNVQVVMDPEHPDARCDPAVVEQTS